MENRTNGRKIILSNDGVTLTFDQRSGQLQSLMNKELTMHTNGLLFDIGIDEQFALEQFVYHDLSTLNTWELPPIVPNPNATASWKFTGHKKVNDRLTMTYEINDLEIRLAYRIHNGTVCISADLTNRRDETRLINGAGFILNHKHVPSETTVEYPGNVPCWNMRVQEIEKYEAVASGLVNPTIHTDTGTAHLNIIFVNPIEKWASAFFRDDHDDLNYVQLAALESDIAPGETLHVEQLYIQLIGNDDPYKPIRQLWATNQWDPPSDGITEGVLYSCHPHGTMDTGFPERRTMAEYAEELEELKAMGIDHVWVLPIFEHLDRGVYHPTDQSIIDTRYGGEESVRKFVKKAHELGMTVLFDYVPHGPAPDDAFGKAHMDWASVDRNGNAQIEWDCLSFDMTNPDYLAYTTDLVDNHVQRFDIDGARIDCAMGGLSNWNPTLKPPNELGQ